MKVTDGTTMIEQANSSVKIIEHIKKIVTGYYCIIEYNEIATMI